MAKNNTRDLKTLKKRGVYNISSGKKVIGAYKRVTSLFSKALGLMFSFKPSYGLLFIFSSETIISLHNFFVFFPIDVIWVSKQGKVVFLKENFKPFRIIFPPKKAMYVLELPKGTIKESNTCMGDTLVFL